MTGHPGKRSNTRPKAGTRPVRARPNAWGLYDMLGNVWEWCEDGWHEGFRCSVKTVLLGLLKPAAGRVIRGGSWDGDARALPLCVPRADGPGVRCDDLGFRCARVQGELKPGQEQASGAPSRPAARPAAADRGAGRGGLAWQRAGQAHRCSPTVPARLPAEGPGAAAAQRP